MSAPILENNPPTATDGDSSLPAWTEDLIQRALPFRRLVVWTAVALQSLVLLSMTIPRSMLRWSGERVLLKVTPVDPRDLFRGDYVILRYEFSGWWSGGLATEQEEVYVPLTLDALKHAHAGTVTWKPPGTGLFLKGRRDRSHGWGYEFGIEQFFVQEGKGKAYEDARNTGHLWAEVSVSPDGTAQIVGLRIE